MGSSVFTPSGTATLDKGLSISPEISKTVYSPHLLPSGMKVRNTSLSNINWQEDGAPPAEPYWYCSLALSDVKLQRGT